MKAYKLTQALKEIPASIISDTLLMGVHSSCRRSLSVFSCYETDNKIGLGIFQERNIMEHFTPFSKFLFSDFIFFRYYFLGISMLS